MLFTIWLLKYIQHVHSQLKVWFIQNIKDLKNIFFAQWQPNQTILWKPKIRQQIFLDTPLVFYSLMHVGSWGECQTYFRVCSEINRYK